MSIEEIEELIDLELERGMSVNMPELLTILEQETKKNRKELRVIIANYIDKIAQKD
jgi:hypothetical protein